MSQMLDYTIMLIIDIPLDSVRECFGVSEDKIDDLV